MIVNLTKLREIDVIEDCDKSPPSLPELNLEGIDQRLQEAIEEGKIVHREGISRTGALVYAAIKKKFDVKWKGKLLCAIDESVKIREPYGINDCSGNEQGLKIIQKVLNDFYSGQTANKDGD
ncbi:Protein LSM12-like protein A [Trichoplax sp. H2]|nr:Protein LSM12-like protein A [Trichoplax sp. H2]|eukprot:RDD38633.1 Protein LSM12-like protein A [Trichoplax sp. H2]